MSHAARPARVWLRRLAAYRGPVFARSVNEVLVTLIPLALLWAAAWMSLSGPRLLTLALAIAIGFS